MGVFIILDLVGFYILFEGVLGGGKKNCFRVSHKSLMSVRV